ADAGGGGDRRGDLPRRRSRRLLAGGLGDSTASTQVYPEFSFGRRRPYSGLPQSGAIMIQGGFMRKAILSASAALWAPPAGAASAGGTDSAASPRPTAPAIAAAAASSSAQGQPLTEAERHQAIQELQDLRA